MTSTADFDERRLSRRGLLGAGLGRALAAHLAAVGGATDALPPPARDDDRRRGPASWGEGDGARLGARVEAAARTLLEACAPAPGARVLDASGGDGLLAALAAARGCRVVAVEGDRRLLERGRDRCAEAGLEVEWRHGSPAAPGVPPASFDHVLSSFGASHHPDPRAVTRALVAAARPGATIALTAWSGLMAEVMTAVEPRRAGRSERWSRYETARLHFADYPGFDVHDHALEWSFADPDDAAAELCGPVDDAVHRERLRTALPAMVERHGTAAEGRLTLRAHYALVRARKP